MIDRTLLRLAFIAVLALSGCNSEPPAISTAPPPPDSSGWRMASGKPPTKAEFAALAATCETKGGALDDCLVNLGLKREQ